MSPTILWSKAKASVKRFFVPFVWSVLLFGLVCYAIIFAPDYEATNYQAFYDFIFNLGTSFAFGFSISLLATVFVEYAVSKPKIWEKFGIGLSLTPVLSSFLAIIIYFWAKHAGMENEFFMMQYTGLLLVIEIFMFYFIMYNHPSNAIGKYFKQVLWGYLVTGILCGGTSLLIWAFYALIWKFPNSEKVYFVVNMFYVCVFFSNFILAGIPKREEKEEAGKVFKAIFGYVVLPLFMILQVILAIYLGKVLVTWSFSASTIGWFIACSGALFFALYFLLKQFGNFDKILKISAWMQVILIPVGVYSLIIRLQNYGLTELRYALFVLYITFFVFAILTLIKKDDTYKHIFAVLAIVMIIATLTPFNIQRVPYLSQEARFVKLLQEQGALNDDYSIKKVNYKTIEEYMEVNNLWKDSIRNNLYLRKEWQKYKNIDETYEEETYYDTYYHGTFDDIFLKNKFTDKQWEDYDEAEMKKWEEKYDYDTEDYEKIDEY